MIRPLAILLLMVAFLATCAKPSPPVAGCFSSPWLYCPAEANGDGDL